MVQEKKQKTDFLDGSHGSHLGLQIYKSTQCFLSSFKSMGLSVQKKKRKIDFQDGGYGGHLGFLIGTVLAFFFLSTSHPDASYQVTSQLAVVFRRRREKQIFKMVAKAAIFDF